MNEIKKFLAEVDAHLEWGRIELTQPFIEEVRRLEKALDKACSELLVMAMTGSDIESWKKNMTYEQWKEWCMSDD